MRLELGVSNCFLRGHVHGCESKKVFLISASLRHFQLSVDVIRTGSIELFFMVMKVRNLDSFQELF